jgi:ABC-type sugar transport system substrate-binding protein
MEQRFHDHTPRVRSRRLVAAAMALVVALGACGGDDDSDSAAADAPATTSASDEANAACLETAEEFLADYEEPPTELPDSLTPLESPPEPGGHIIKIVNGNIPSDGNSAEAQARAAEAIGWTADVITHDGTVEDLNRAWQQAIAEQPTAIAGSGFPAAALQQPIANATAAGIIVALSSVTDEATEYPGFAATANGVATAEQLGEIHAHLLMRDSQCQGHVAIFSLPFPILTVVTDRFQEVLESECPECEASLNEIQPTDLGSPAATGAIVSALQADPSVKYAYTIIANLAVGVPTALDQAGIDDVRIFGQVPDETAIAALQDDTNAWWLTQSSQINGWLELDSVLRAIEGEAPVNTTGNPIGVLTQANVPQGSSEIPIYPADYEELFQELWGVGG